MASYTFAACRAVQVGKECQLDLRAGTAGCSWQKGFVPPRNLSYAASWITGASWMLNVQ